MKYFSLFIAVIAISLMSFAQRTQHGLAIKPVNNLKNITGSITSTNNYIANSTMVLTFDVYVIAPDSEFIDGIEMTFPSGMTPIVTGTSDPFTANNGCIFLATGQLNPISGQVISWGEVTNPTGCGWWDPSPNGSTITISVGVNVGNISGAQSISYRIVGDGYGSTPHEITGTVIVNEAYANDVGMASIDFGNRLTGAFNPAATVKNFGSAAQSFDVVMNITPGGYTSTQTVTSLAVLNDQQITFANWDPTPGTYNVEVYTTLASDEDNNNDTLKATIEIVELTYTIGTIYGYNALDFSGSGLEKYIVTIDSATGAQTGLALASTANFLTCGDFVGDSALYGVEYGTNDLYIVNGDGMTFKVGTINGVNSVTGLAYDGLNGIIYLSDWSGASSDLYTLNMGTMTATLVGTMTDSLVIGLAAGNAGELWAIEINSDSLLSVNTTTGDATPIGYLGVDIYYAQDIGYDRYNNILYGTLYSTAGGLYTIDVATGAATLVGTFTDEITMCAIAPTNTTTSIQENAATFTMYPNPADNMITINVDNDALVTITDMAGRVVYNSQINKTAHISVADFNSGIYFVTVRQNNESETIKLVVE